MGNLIPQRMTSRKRVKAAIRHEPVDRLPVKDNLWDQIAPLWKQQGLPDDTAPEDYFGFDIVDVFIDSSPRLEQKIISREDGYVTYDDRYGYRVRKLDGKSGTLDFLSHKTTDKSVWESQIRPGLSLNPYDSARIDTVSYFAHFEPYPTWEEAVEKYKSVYETDKFVLFQAYGPWEATWRHRGLNNLLMDIALDPGWVKEMAGVYIDHVLSILKHCLALGMQPDGFFLVEDLGCNRGLLFSPKMWRETYRPAFEKLGTFLMENRIDFLMHSCGNVEELFDDLIECGLKVMQPLQVSSGLDVVNLRKNYGNQLAFWGNFSAEEMAGPIESLKESIHRKVDGTQNGGYIFGSDHSIPPDISFERYKWIIEEAQKVFSAGKKTTSGVKTVECLNKNLL